MLSLLRVQVYEFTVEENLPEGTMVGAITAEDNDLGNNASLRYSLEPTHPSFTIHPMTGEAHMIGEAPP